MILSRAFPTLIRLNQVIKFSNAKTQFLSSFQTSRLSLLNKHCPGAFLAFQARAMSLDVEKEMGDPKRHFDYKQLLEKQKDKSVVVIDVREHSEINETGKIPGSINIPLAELGKALGELSGEEFKQKYSAEKPQKDTEVIFSCKAGGRSLKAFKLALELGYSKAGNFKGGWLDWAENSKASK